MGGTLDLYQIFYDQSQREQLYDFAKPVFSIGLTPYFENQFIAAFVPQSQADYISVCSWRLRKKRSLSQIALGMEPGTEPIWEKQPEGLMGKELIKWYNEGHPKNFNPRPFETTHLTKERIEKAMPFDVAILTPGSPSHKPLVMAPMWHGKAWVDAYNAFKPFLRQFGKVPDELKYSIYENHFIARKEIYHDYVKDYLLPAVKYIGDDPVYFVDSLYVPKKKDQTEISRVQKLLKANDWPILPFLLERLFSFYINDKGFNVIKL